MARIGFHGFKAGTAVELALRQFGRRIPARAEKWSDPEAMEPSPESWDALPATAKAEVTVWRSEMEVGPEGFYFQVTGYDGFDTPAPEQGETYDRRYHELVYLWNFDDEGATWLAPENVQDHQRNANISYGPQVSHTYTKPGTYSPSVIIFEPSSGKLAKVVLGPFTVQDPDVFFAGSKTHYVDDEGVYADAPDGAVNYSDVRLAMAAIRGKGPVRVMIRCDRDYDLQDFPFAEVSGNTYRNVYLCNDGTGVNPRIHHIRKDRAALFDFISKWFRPAGNGADVVFTGLDLVGQWDSVTETGDSMDGILFRGGEPEQYPNHVLLHNVNMTGFDQAISFVGGPHKLTLIVNDSTVTDYRDYALYGGADRIALTGSRLMHHIDAAGGGYKNGAHNQHGNMRLGFIDSCVMDGCDFFSHVGWFQNYAPYHSAQPVLRWNFMGQEDPNENALNMQRCSAEGGTTVLACSHMNNNKSVANNNVLFERNTIVGTWQTNNMIYTMFGGVTIRFNRMIFTDPLRIDFHLFQPSKFVEFQNYGLAVEGSTEIDPIRVDFNTCINLASSANAKMPAGWEGVPVFADGTIGESTNRIAAGILRGQGNLLHQPNLDTPDVLYGPLDTTPIWQARGNGYKDSGGSCFMFTTPIPAGGTFEIPYTLDSDPMIDLSTLTAADFAGGDHFLLLKSTGEKLSDGAFSITFGASSAIVTNLTGKQIETTYDGNKENFIDFRFDRSQGPRPRERDTQWATPTNSVATFAPLLKSKALGAGPEDADAVLDFYGRRRPAYPSLGAQELIRKT